MGQQLPTLSRALEPASSTARAFKSAHLLRASPGALTSLACASHDMRDPLQAIACCVDLLADGACGAVSAEQRVYLDRLRGQLEHVTAIVGSILTLARAADRSGGLELTEIPVLQVLDRVRLLVEPHAGAAGVSLSLDGARAPAIVRGEPTALVRVLVNLADNAIRATPRGGRVTLSARARGRAVDLQVTDTGRGIRAAQLGSIFEPFVQLRAASENEKGLGLGLTIARDLTHLMGGELLVESVVDVGSRFTVRIPSVPPHEGTGISAALRAAA
jgi:signal transduction histidine kinase